MANSSQGHVQVQRRTVRSVSNSLIGNAPCLPPGTAAASERARTRAAIGTTEPCREAAIGRMVVREGSELIRVVDLLLRIWGYKSAVAVNWEPWDHASFLGAVEHEVRNYLPVLEGI